MIYDITFADENKIKTTLAHALGRVETIKNRYAYVRIDEYPEPIKVIGKYESSNVDDSFLFELETNQMVFVAMIYVGNDEFQHSCYHQRDNDWVYTLVQVGKKTSDIEVTLLNSSDVTASLAIREGKTPSFISAKGNAAQEFVDKITKAPVRKKLILPETPKLIV